MSRSVFHIPPRIRFIVLGLLGMGAGAFVAANFNPLPLGPRVVLTPAPWCIGKIPGQTTLRMAMVHDILCQRYLLHGDAWNRQRIADARQILGDDFDTHPSSHQPTSAQPVATQTTSAHFPSSQPTSPSTGQLNAMDDLAIALARTGQLDAAIAVMRKKLPLVSPLPTPEKRQIPFNLDPYNQTEDVEHDEMQRMSSTPPLSPLKQQQYTTCANLGTTLIHRYMHATLAGDEAATAKVREGLDFIERSIDLNLRAHFGRERWQAIAVESLLADVQHPELLVKYDLIGDSMQSNPALTHRILYGHLMRMYEGMNDATVDFPQRLHLRTDLLVEVGMDRDWAEIVQPDYTAPMPFDEPTLAIIGMWTLGGGPNPHFAMTLGRIMEDVDQHYIAWEGYERAVEMKDAFGPTKAMCDQLAGVCRERQNFIAQEVAPDDPDAWQTQMRTQFQKELAWGQAYQKAYRNYEAERIAAGVSLDAPDFYTSFFANRPPIASPVGMVDQVLVTNMAAKSLGDWLPCLILGLAGGMAFALIVPEKWFS